METDLPSRRPPEVPRAQRLFEAFTAASVAAGRARRPEDVYPAASQALRQVGLHVNIFDRLPDGRAGLREVTYAPELIARAEKLLGVSVQDFTVDPSRVHAYAQVLHDGRTVFLDDTVELLSALVPSGAGAVASAVVRMLGIGRVIAAPLRGDEAVDGMLLVLGDDLGTLDIPAVEAFAHLLGLTRARVTLTTRLEASVAELQQTQARLLHAQRLETLGLLTAGIAHDFNNLLTPATFAQEVLELRADPELRKWVDIVGAALERSTRLTKQLLALGRRQQLHVAVIDLHAVIVEGSRLLERILGDGLLLDLRLDADRSWVRADRSQLEQVLLNLVVNARDALSVGGRVCISTSNESRRLPGHAADADHDCLRLAVEDDGSGMSAQVLQRVFEPFFSTKPAGVGSGLGLPVVEGIVEQHGGMLTIESHVGRGTTVVVRLPVQDHDARPHAPPPVEVELASIDRDIWVLEDRTDIRRLVAAALRSKGARVSTAASLAQARQLIARANAPALLVSDIVLPDGFGVDFAAELREACPQLRVLLMSGHPLDDEVGRRAAEVSDGYLLKPFTRMQLLRAVAEALGLDR